MIPGESEMDLSTLMLYSDLSGPKNNELLNWVTENREVIPGVSVSKTVIPDRDKDVPVRIINVTKNPVAVKAGTVISDLDSAQFNVWYRTKLHHQGKGNSVRNGGRRG